MFWTCKIRFGTVDLADLQDLCAIYAEFQDPQEKVSWISLGTWKKLTRGGSKRLLDLYLKYHTADEGLLQKDCLLQNKHIKDAYLHSLLLRKIGLTKAEETWLINCDEPWAMLCIKEKYPLSINSEVKLLKSGKFDMINEYIGSHVLSDVAETLLAHLATEKRRKERTLRYQEILKRYFEMQYDKYGHRVFTSAQAQRALFAYDKNDEYIMKVLKQYNLDDFVLESDIIRYMASEMNPKYLACYLAHSYIADKGLTTELLEGNLPEHLQDMIAVSELRRTIYVMFGSFWIRSSDDWYDEEYEAYAKYVSEDDKTTAVENFLQFLQPRFAEGAISPAMSAYIAALFPELAKEAQINLNRHIRHQLNGSLYNVPLNLHHLSGVL